MRQAPAMKKLACSVLMLLMLLTPVGRAEAAAVQRWSIVLDCVMLPVESRSQRSTHEKA